MPLVIAYLIPLLVYAVTLDARGAIKHGPEQCFDQNHNKIKCPKKPLTTAKIIGIVIACGAILAVIVFFTWRYLCRRRSERKIEDDENVPLPTQVLYDPPYDPPKGPPPHGAAASYYA